MNSSATTTGSTAAVAAAALEVLPSTWTTDDDAFFRVVAEVLPSGLLAGAGVLLMSYDDTTAPAAGPGPGTA